MRWDVQTAGRRGVRTYSLGPQSQLASLRVPHSLGVPSLGIVSLLVCLKWRVPLLVHQTMKCL